MNIIRLILIAVLFLPLMMMAENEVPYDKELDAYVGTWKCMDNVPDPQWIPCSFEIKKKGRFLKFTFYRRSGKAPEDFYSGSFQYLGDGVFEWECLPGVRYYDSRPDRQNVFKYGFRTHYVESGWGVDVTKWFYNELGEIDTEVIFLHFKKDIK